MTAHDDNVERLHADYLRQAAWLHENFCVGKMFMYLGAQFVVTYVSTKVMPAQFFDMRTPPIGGDYHPVVHAETLVGEGFVTKIFRQDFLEAACKTTAAHVVDG